MVQVKHKFNTALGKMLQPQPVSEADIEAPYIKSMHVQWHGVSFEDLPCMWASPADIAQLNLQVGDLMVCEGGEVGRGALVLNDPPPFCIFQNALHRVRASDANDVRYLNYCLKQASEAGWFEVLCNRATIAHFTVEKFRELRLHLPSGESQRLIADYLDRETARIDGLIAEKERMLALLEEKRAALISRVVTRGLDPNALLKLSGQEWLGEIPAHWYVLRLKFATRGIDQGSSPQCYAYPAEPGEWGVLKTGCVNGGEFREHENKALPDGSEAFPESEVHQGDVLMSRASGSADLIGSVALVSRQPAARLLLSDKIYRIRFRGDVLDSRFLVLAMSAGYLRHQIKSVISGAEGLANNIAKSDIMELLIVVPPVLEQVRIASCLGRAITSNKLHCESLRESIVLAKERRAALITAAVTGQIPLEEMTG